ncbi:hypothetical protein KL942_005396 [Ogataea angusta]|uniref:Uncharacterized protein n=1 Tax=Pichia angusta TaxID=870730 RepID=A0ABQ7RPA5_PICAN|nr:hypothetical protein KL942_005396 [Ogataea angusta]KAG7842904.1 hypothetical protein KL941_004934 [Ogataea angusta]KAG7844975.1 hypothetical protein KL940_005397 [Ogataea angusta]KAG7876613.1 hypothetical protein KL938_004225 [Ogataea parapolymorpha]
MAATERSIPDADTSRRLANLSQEEKREYARQKRAILFNETSADLPSSMQSPVPLKLKKRYATPYMATYTDENCAYNLGVLENGNQMAECTGWGLFEGFLISTGSYSITVWVYTEPGCDGTSLELEVNAETTTVCYYCTCGDLQSSEWFD